MEKLSRTFKLFTIMYALLVVYFSLNIGWSAVVFVPLNLFLYLYGIVGKETEGKNYRLGRWKLSFNTMAPHWLGLLEINPIEERGMNIITWGWWQCMFIYDPAKWWEVPDNDPTPCCEMCNRRYRSQHDN
jgi:hypothetical protein